LKSPSRRRRNVLQELAINVIQYAVIRQLLMEPFKIFKRDFVLDKSAVSSIANGFLLANVSPFCRRSSQNALKLHANGAFIIRGPGIELTGVGNLSIRLRRLALLALNHELLAGRRCPIGWLCSAVARRLGWPRKRKPE
jgi:hypothetical protein